MKDLVSVIIPSYNHEKYIKECVMSVVNQTYTNLEIIIMDDCSTDNSQKILKSIKDKRIKLFCSSKNKGTVKTVNELMKKCKGKYIGIIGSDDVWMEDKIEKQVKFLRANPSIGAVFSETEIIDENGDIYVDDAAFNHSVFHNENMTSGKRMKLFFENGNHLCHSSSLIRKNVVDKIGLYDITYRQLHDFEYWVRLVNNYDIHILSEKLVKYRRFKNSKQNLSNNSYEGLIRVVNETNAIIDWMFNNMRKEIFIDGFSDIFVNKNSKTMVELDCEKYFILLNYKIAGVNNKELAFSFIYSSKNKVKVFEMLDKKFNYSLDKFYKDTGKTYDTFNYDFLLNSSSQNGKVLLQKETLLEERQNEIMSANNTINNLNDHINKLYNSTSWKVTKPLRKIKGLINHGKSK